MPVGVLRSKPLGRAIDAAVDTDGIAVDMRPSVFAGKTVHQVQVTSGALAFVAWGPAALPPAPTTTNTAYLEAGATMVYTMGGVREDELYFYVYAVTGTVEVRLSFFG